MKSWLKEPLVHFLAAGAALFALASWIWPAPEAGRVITIGEAQLLDHLQARAQLYDEEGFAELLANMSDEERVQLVRDAAVAEALYREGQALGLAEADPMVKQRVIQQMRLLVMEEEATEVALSDADVRAFYDANSQRYAEGARASFTHVFFAKDRRGDAAEADARAALAQLNSGDVPFGNAGQYGDRFLYQLNYAEAGAREIAGQFGEGFTLALYALEPGEDWQGPLESSHGWHLVGLRAKAEPRVPPFEDVAARVAEDALAEARSTRAMAAIDRLMESYEIHDEAGGQ
ncbi:peptidyl-prolyl cis-trans isomerase [Alteraurantiacibacter aquimixticola]|uniref:Parvulin-like PPIase n=1 Tax=Alteraurantiacibacter aquimixticola TaxID=2489173 RepID=A0A4T3F0U3_9SPHN|nr:peptidylprolyl isomerase [Alteraurantiacibacter aquimixticola]TIX49537.1 peptidyl-prolyl cis-trans isomerase [Alteraurantiacibacter aquimixticola]